LKEREKERERELKFLEKRCIENWFFISECVVAKYICVLLLPLSNFCSSYSMWLFHEWLLSPSCLLLSESSSCGLNGGTQNDISTP
jgi:hypothetical protein